MMFEEDFARLEKRRQLMQRAGWAAALCTVFAFAGAIVFWPGAFGLPGQFRNVQLDWEIARYFTIRGIETSKVADSLVLGLRLGAIRGVLNLIGVLVIVVGVGSLLRLQLRWALGCAVLWFALSSFSNLLTNRAGGYEVADTGQFGVHWPGSPAPRLPTVSGGFADVTRALGDGGRIEAIRAEMAARDAARLQRAAIVRRAFDDTRGMTPTEAAAMHYTAAQVAYLEQDLPAVTRQLNAISRRDYENNCTSDYRLRFIQEWAERNGARLAPGAYRPTTGLSLAHARIVATVFAALGGALMVMMILLVELRRKLVRRLVRMRAMADELTVPEVRRMPSHFGRRLVNARAKLATNSLAGAD